MSVNVRIRSLANLAGCDDNYLREVLATLAGRMRVSLDEAVAAAEDLAHRRGPDGIASIAWCAPPP